MVLGKTPKSLAPVRKHHAQGPRAHTVRGGRALGNGKEREGVGR